MAVDHEPVKHDSRLDVQGLRAVAVLLVIAFHAGLPVGLQLQDVQAASGEADMLEAGLAVAPARIAASPTTLFQLGTVDWVDGTASGFEFEKDQEQEHQLGLFDLEPTS